jgi:radical SAM-linked protein
VSDSQGREQVSETRIRVRYAKTGKLRFVSAIDLGRLWERALRKAQLPIAYSEGFSPHPKVSFPDALPLGYASTGEYAELTFAAPVAIEHAVKALNAAFPEGLEVLAAVEVADGAPRLSKWLKASLWDVDYADSVDADRLAEAAQAVLALDAVVVDRARKDEVVQVDARPAVGALSAAGRRIRALVHHVEPPIRPSELHAALAGPYRSFAHTALPAPSHVTRVAQGTPAGDGLIEALSGALVAVEPQQSERTIST